MEIRNNGKKTYIWIEPTLFGMKQTIARKVAALTKKAKQEGKKTEPKAVIANSSLHQVIKTKEQAALFMKLLREAW